MTAICPQEFSPVPTERVLSNVEDPSLTGSHLPWEPPLKAALLRDKSLQLWEVAKKSESHLSFLLFVRCNNILKNIFFLIGTYKQKHFKEILVHNQHPSFPLTY